jgi:hypothetical protein
LPEAAAFALAATLDEPATVLLAGVFFAGALLLLARACSTPALPLAGLPSCKSQQRLSHASQHLLAFRVAMAKAATAAHRLHN